MSRLIAGAACALLLAAACAASASAAPGLGTGEAATSALPTVTATELEGSPPGYYRVPRVLSAPLSTPAATVVYWMPHGTAADAPAEIKALPAYQEDAALGTFAIADITYYDTDAASADPVVAAAVACPDYWFCLYENSSWGGTMKRFQSNSWQHLSDFGFNDRTSSTRNMRFNDGLLSEHIDGSDNPGGTVRCFDSRSSTSSLGTFNDDASGVFNSTVDSRC